MKNKIKEALRQEYKSRLELDDERLDGVAAFASTFVTDEAKIEEFVKNDATFAMLKSYQSVVDKDRARRKQEPEPKPQPSEPATNPEPPKPTEQPDFKAMFAEALAEVVNPLKEELAQYKAEQGAKAALATAEATFKGNDYVKKYTDEAADAWERATEMYEATGKSWTVEELQTKAMGYFNKAVSRKGVDTTKPFVSDRGGVSADEADKAFADEIRKALGKDKE